ncbi:MAG: threonylcarbamoyl-AMP synthase [Puniceicoccales bacterium]|jgi:L-threonylcarbamoyladenylate synthase|nr:threonylcarbamoyl-AMP synthase [Puniceicoccales bacterium]
MDELVRAASSELLGGGVVVLPTETVYGLAANALDQSAVARIFEIKGRPLADPLIVHVLDGSWVRRYADIGSSRDADRVRKIVDAFWPGPLTMVLPRAKIIPNVVTAGLGTVAVRCPRHTLFQAVLRVIDLPLAAPSANPFGYVSPTSAEQVRKTLGAKVGTIIDGGRCAVGLESTILDLAHEFPKILRPGAVTAAEISSILGEEVIGGEDSIVSAVPNAPGQLKQHYCTHTQLILFANGERRLELSPNGKVAVIFNGKPLNFAPSGEGVDVFWLSDVGELDVMAKNLFATLQTIDGRNYDKIFCERPIRSGIGVAIDDRLLRAAAKFIPR